MRFVVICEMPETYFGEGLNVHCCKKSALPGLDPLFSSDLERCRTSGGRLLRQDYSGVATSSTALAAAGGTALDVRGSWLKKERVPSFRMALTARSTAEAIATGPTAVEATVTEASDTYSSLCHPAAAAARWPLERGSHRHRTRRCGGGL